MGVIFEDIAREFVYELLRNGKLDGLRVGSWWSNDGKHEIDIAVSDGQRITAVGTVRWRSTQLGADVYDNLMRHAHALGAASDIPKLMISRGGTPESVRVRDP